MNDIVNNNKLRIILDKIKGPSSTLTPDTPVEDLMGPVDIQSVFYEPTSVSDILLSRMSTDDIRPSDATEDTVDTVLKKLSGKQDAFNSLSRKISALDKSRKTQSKTLTDINPLGSLTNEYLGVANKTLNNIWRFHQNQTTNYYKKNLQLQYKQLLTSTELLESFKSYKRVNAVQTNALIVNTGANDFVKETLMTKVQAMARESIARAITDSTDGYTDKLMYKIPGKLRGIGQKIQDSDEDSKLSKLKGIADFIYGVKNDPRRLMHSKLDGKSTGIGFIDSLLSRVSTSLESNLGKDSNTGVVRVSRNPNDSSTFDNKTHHSINVIIPKLLAAIRSEVRAQRTGEYEDTLFSFGSSELTSKRSSESTVKSKIQSKLMGRGYGKAVGNLRETIGAGLSSKDSRILEKEIISRATKGTGLTVEGLKESGILDKLSPKGAINVLSRLSSISESSRAKKRLTSMFGKIRSSQVDSNSILSELIDEGHSDTLTDMGYVKTDVNGNVVSTKTGIGSIKGHGRGYGSKQDLYRESGIDKLSEKLSKTMSKTMNTDTSDDTAPVVESVESLITALKERIPKPEKALRKGSWRTLLGNRASEDDHRDERRGYSGRPSGKRVAIGSKSTFSLTDFLGGKKTTMALIAGLIALVTPMDAVAQVFSDDKYKEGGEFSVAKFFGEMATNAYDSAVEFATGGGSDGESDGLGIGHAATALTAGGLLYRRNKKKKKNKLLKTLEREHLVQQLRKAEAAGDTKTVKKLNKKLYDAWGVRKAGRGIKDVISSSGNIAKTAGKSAYSMAKSAPVGALASAAAGVTSYMTRRAANSGKKLLDTTGTVLGKTTNVVGNAAIMSGRTGYKGVKNVLSGRVQSHKSTIDADHEKAMAKIRGRSRTKKNVMSSVVDGKIVNSAAMGKAGSKSLLKKVPLLGLAAATAFAIDRLVNDGDVTGAMMEMGSGFSSLFPGVGTGGSFAIDAALLAHDHKRNTESEERALPEYQSGGTPNVLSDRINKYVSLEPGVDLININKKMLDNYLRMAQEYFNSTGRRLRVTSGYRSMAKQAQLYAKDPSIAAKPGSSLHNYGLAIDMYSVDANALDNMGLMKKYGFVRPVGGETWHVECVGVSTNVRRAKTDTAWVNRMIGMSPGKGGGGIGSIKGSTRGSRRTNLLMSRFKDSPIAVTTKRAVIGNDSDDHTALTEGMSLSTLQQSAKHGRNKSKEVITTAPSEYSNTAVNSSIKSMSGVMPTISNTMSSVDKTLVKSLGVQTSMLDELLIIKQLLAERANITLEDIQAVVVNSVPQTQQGRTFNPPINMSAG